MPRPGSSPRHPAVCSGTDCGALIWFCRVAGSPMPLNAQPDDAGNIAACPDRDWIPARVISPGDQLADGEQRWMPHWRTCTSPAAFRKRQRHKDRPVREAGQPAQLALIPSTGDDQ